MTAGDEEQPIEGRAPYTMLFALIRDLGSTFQIRTVSDLYPYGLFLHPVKPGETCSSR